MSHVKCEMWIAEWRQRWLEFKGNEQRAQCDANRDGEDVKERDEFVMLFAMTIYLILGYRIGASDISILRRNGKKLSNSSAWYEVEWLCRRMVMWHLINFTALNHHYLMVRWLHTHTRRRPRSFTYLVFAESVNWINKEMIHSERQLNWLSILLWRQRTANANSFSDV